MAFVQSNVAQFTFEVSGLDRELRVVRFTGSEGLSHLFRFTLELATEDPELDFGAVIGKPGCLTIYGDNGERYVNGIVSRFEQAAERGRFTIYQAELVPYLWLLALRHKSRIFQHLSVPDIIAKVLQEARLSSDRYRFVLQNQYEPREYCVQYRESEFNFLSRLMEEEGIFYFFEHTKESHVLVMADGAAAHAPIAEPASVIFHATTGTVPTEEYVYQYRYTEEVRPGAVVLRDFDFTKPSLTLQAEVQADKDTALECYDYPGVYVDPGRGAALAHLRLEAFQAPRKVGGGSSVCRRFVPGYRFKLAQHHRSTFNQEYVLTQVSHTAAQPQVLEEWSTGTDATYANEFTCLPASVPFRPPRVTPKPVVKGSQTAIVVGPKGEEIYTDEYGRVKVQFHWDRDGQYDEKSSCWIRVSQGWAGAGWGGIYLPRITQEVIVDFLEGDPDQPLITGRVYNGENPTPYKLPDEKTKSTLKSDSSKGSKGFNEIRFEDKKGEEQVFVHAEKNMDIRVKNDVYEWVGRNTHLIVQQDQYEQIGNDRHETIARDHVEEIGRDHYLKIKGKEAIEVDGSHSFTVQGDVTEVFQADHSEETTGDVYITASNIVIEAMSNITIKVGQSYIAIDASGITIGTTGTLELKSMAPLSLEGTAGVTVESSAQVSVKGTAMLTLESTAMAQLKSPMTTVQGDGMLRVQGGIVMIN
jgi:type VI secretion system secreted protein VgrG